YGILECEIINTSNGDKFSMKEVLKFNNTDIKYMDDDLFNLSPSDEKIKRYIERISSTLFHHLLNVVNGDFSWSEKLIEFKKNVRMIQEKFKTPFVFDLPTYKKLETGDPSWRDDLVGL
ncbi:MAG: hypothetical protein LC109_06140, partial [Bacteroidia bacterium]|nr:hypothetical protein [Bacteroidia bacterium]